MAKDCRLLSRIATVAAAFIALTFATGSHCGNENSVTGPSLTPTPTPAPTPTPTPGPAIDISGNWAGTFVTSDPRCVPGTVSLTLTVSQAGSQFSTELSGLPCNSGESLQGTVGPNVGGVAPTSGTAQAAHLTGSFAGTVSSSNIHLITPKLENSTLFFYLPSGTLDLHR
jgi:hypothetical protein